MRMLTTIIELVAFALLIAAAALFVAQWSAPAAVAVAGVGLLVVSLLIQRPWRKP